MPFISEITCSMGMVTRFSTSLGDAPGKGIKISANVTSICGSSSFGVMVIANIPSNKPTIASRGVIAEPRKYWAIRPEIFSCLLII